MTRFSMRRRPARRIRTAGRFGLAALALTGLLGLAGCGASVVPEVHSEPERLSTAQRMANSGNLTAAVTLLKGYIDRNAGSAEVDGAIYLLGECYLRQKEWPSAQLEFERLLHDYPESDSAGSASFQVGSALWGQSRGADFDPEFTEKALAQWQNYRTSFPGHWRNAEADRRIVEARAKLAHKYLDNARLYLKLRLAVPSRRYFMRVLDDYGDLPESGAAAIGMAHVDVLEGKKELAIQRLRRIEEEHAGQPAAQVARRERERIEKMKVRDTARATLKSVPSEP